MKVCKMNAKRKAFVIAALEVFGVDKDTITRPEILVVMEENPKLSFSSLGKQERIFVPRSVVSITFRTKMADTC